MRVGLFISCLTDSFCPRAGMAAVLLLEHLGHDVVFPAGQTCCGQPLVTGGFAEPARAAARHTIAALAGCAAIVTPSASCCSTIRAQYPALLQDDAAAHAEAVDLAARTWEFVEFLERVLRFDPGAHGARRPGRVVCHDSCHRRIIGAGGAAQRLLEAVAELEVAAPADDPPCCGFGGAFAVRYPEISGVMTRAKVDAVTGAGRPEALVADDPGCAMNIAGACRRAGATLPCLSTAEILAEALGLLARETR